MNKIIQTMLKAQAELDRIKKEREITNGIMNFIIITMAVFFLYMLFSSN